jgi:hypothetical protein
LLEVMGPTMFGDDTQGWRITLVGDQTLAK